MSSFRFPYNHFKNQAQVFKFQTIHTLKAQIDLFLFRYVSAASKCFNLYEHFQCIVCKYLYILLIFSHLNLPFFYVLSIIWTNFQSETKRFTKVVTHFKKNFAPFLTWNISQDHFVRISIWPKHCFSSFFIFYKTLFLCFKITVIFINTFFLFQMGFFVLSFAGQCPGLLAICIYFASISLLICSFRNSSAQDTIWSAGGVMECPRFKP